MLFPYRSQQDKSDFQRAARVGNQLQAEINLTVSVCLTGVEKADGRYSYEAERGTMLFPYRSQQDKSDFQRAARAGNQLQTEINLTVSRFWFQSIRRLAIGPFVDLKLTTQDLENIEELLCLFDRC